MWEGPAYCGQCHPWKGGPMLNKKAGWANHGVKVIKDSSIASGSVPAPGSNCLLSVMECDGVISFNLLPASVLWQEGKGKLKQFIWEIQCMEGQIIDLVLDKFQFKRGSICTSLGLETILNLWCFLNSILPLFCFAVFVPIDMMIFYFIF